MTGLLAAAAVGAVLALVVSWALRRRPSPRHRAGPGRPASSVVVPPARPTVVGDRATAPILSFGTERVR